jgi:hypothetical protein
MRPQTSALERLRSLPDIFRGGDLTVRFQWTSKTASQYLYLWKRRGLVRGLGGHSDVFANMLQCETPNWEKAMVIAMPSSLAIGIDMLRGAGWVTQIQHRPTIAVQIGRPVYDVEPYVIEQRPESWYALIQPGLLPESIGYHRLPMLRPAWALADMLHEQGWGACGLQPDDLYADEMSEQDEQDWQAACAAFNLSDELRKPLFELVELSR